MRTTLKRGMGRAAAVNGNGRAVLPPGALSAVTIYRQPEPERRSRLSLAAAILGWAIVTLLMAVGAVGGGYYLFLEQRVSDLRATTPDVVIAQRQLDIAPANGPATALIVGYDKRKGEDAGVQSRSDTVMLVRADPGSDSISLLSFPRDLTVDVTCPGKPTYRGRINEAYSECGTTGTLETVRKLTGLPINYLVTVNFRGFRQVVDSLGGVWLDVDRRYFNDRGGPFGYATINLQPGYQKLTGYQALDYVRYRHVDSDLARIVRQQLFVGALKAQIRDQLSGTSLALTVPRLVSAITKNVEVGRGGDKEVDIDLLRSYALLAYSLPPGHVFQTTIEGLEEDASYQLHAAPESLGKAIQEFTNPDVESPDKATAVALNEKPKRKAAKAPLPRNTTVTVLNGNGVDGSAANASYLLGQRGYAMLSPPEGRSADAPSYDYFETEVAYDPRQSGTEAAARNVAALFGTDEIVPMTAKTRRLGYAAMLLVTLGQTHHGRLAEAPVDKTPKKQPPNVEPGAEASLGYLRERMSKLPFTVMVPTVIERNSSIDDSGRPVRLYWIDEPDNEHKTLRLTYRSGTWANEYWGVQMTDWMDAPVLSERNHARLIGGRAYELHYTGPKLHMVVLRHGGATYWVVNTLKNSLSNDTMLAIAKGLKPIARIK
ncbi:MAG: LCP family protein [Actinomycetota bacterium]|nr:LCP family protein [Actinomycetota bacterium]